ncbi:MAG: terminase gpA endonuclease subunit, partial [Spirochaetota bacterium]
MEKEEQEKTFEELHGNMKCGLAAVQEGRTLAASKFKMFFLSTPATAGACQISRSFLHGDQREWFVPCPHCGEMQILVLKRSDQNHGLTCFTEKREGKRGKKGRFIVPDSVRYICKFCAQPFRDSQRKSIMSRGEWRPCWDEIPPKNEHHISFHVSGLMSPFLSWERLCNEWLKTGFGKELLALKNFKINILGEPWDHIKKRADWELFKARAGDYAFGEVPGAGESGGLLLVGGVDVQGDRLELAVCAFGSGLECWLIEYQVFYGKLDDVSSGAWKLMADYCYDYRHEVIGPIAQVAVDCGYNPQEAEYRKKDFARKVHIVREFVFANWGLFRGVKGAGDKKSLLISPLRVPGGTCYNYDVSQVKDYLFANFDKSS